MTSKKPHVSDTLTLLYEANHPFPHRVWQSDGGYIQIDYMEWEPGESLFPASVKIFCDGVLESEP